MFCIADSSSRVQHLLSINAHNRQKRVLTCSLSADDLFLVNRFSLIPATNNDKPLSSHHPRKQEIAAGAAWRDFTRQRYPSGGGFVSEWISAGAERVYGAESQLLLIKPESITAWGWAGRIGRQKQWINLDLDLSLSKRFISSALKLQQSILLYEEWIK